MSAIDELKDGAKASNKVNMMGNSSPKRATVSINSIKESVGMKENNDEETQEDAKGYVETLLDTDNPNSMFMQHYNEKVEEASEWLAAKREEEAEKEYSSKHDEPDDEKDNVNESNEEDSNEDNSEYGVSLDSSEDEDLEHPEMINTGLDQSNVISMNIPDASESSDDDFGVSLDGGNASSNSSSSEEISIDATGDDNNEESETKEVKESSEEVESFTSDVNIEAKVSTEKRNFEDTEEPDDESDTVDIEAQNDENMKRLQKIVAERLKPASLGLDLSSFTVVKKAEMNADEIFDSYKARVSKWVAMNQESVIYMREFSGSELELLMEYYNTYTGSIRLARRYDTATIDTRSARQMYQMIYDHLEGAKPANFVTWLKITPVSDIDNYFFAIYISSFLGTNFIPVDCQECRNSYVTEDMNIMDTMVKFPTQEARDKFTEIYNSNQQPASKGLYTTEVIPLTDLIAIGFKEPSIDDMLSINELDRAASEEFSSIITFVPYIDNIYKIDQVHKQLIPIDYKKFNNNKIKTLRSKIRKYNGIFTSMGVDSFTPVKAYISALDEKTGRGIDYVIPETTCPECGHVNPEMPIGNGEVADMVFTRCQLGALVSTSIS